ncbi:MAG TPA: hypothetical protein PJ986_13640 [Gammaproteobacteria bacterium]|nr:hypothetical protein [Gammaproteobacteria bacterium]
MPEFYRKRGASLFFSLAVEASFGAAFATENTEKKNRKRRLG